MRNFVQPGDVLSLVAPATLASGDGFIVGALFAVALKNAASGAKVDAVVEGVVELPKATGAITQGALVYWDATAKKVTATSSGNTLIGKAAEAAGAGAVLTRIRLSN